MYGTEKQILYAHDIIINAYTHIDNVIKHYIQKRDTEGERWYVMNNDVVEAANCVREWIDRCVNRVDDAYKWIEAKDKFSVPQLNNRINKYIFIICKKAGRMEMIELPLSYRPRED